MADELAFQAPGKAVVKQGAHGPGAHVWLIRLDRPDQPRLLSPLEMDSPRFDRAGVFCRGRETEQMFI
jgi:hypothetical protein